jgi:hypothetical protein
MKMRHRPRVRRGSAAPYRRATPAPAPRIVIIQTARRFGKTTKFELMRKAREQFMIECWPGQSEQALHEA